MGNPRSRIKKAQLFTNRLRTVKNNSKNKMKRDAVDKANLEAF
jgi:hypothetical protein